MSKNLRKFYETHKNFSDRRISEYYLSPGIRCKFDILKTHLANYRSFEKGIDLGCSGNSFLYFFDKVKSKSFLDIVEPTLEQYRSNEMWHPICGDISNLPYRNNSFDFLSALSVLEHVKSDNRAISEIRRITKKGSIVVITVPHRMKYYTSQDKLIGHYRRYEINQIIKLFKQKQMKVMKIFGIYGQIMRISDIQSLNPEKLEENLIRLRKKFDSSTIFRIIWSIFVWIGAKIMKIDAKHQHPRKIMNVGFIFRKI